MRVLPGRAARAASAGAVQEMDGVTAAGEQRRRIRRATGDLVAKRGYAGVSVELIVKRAKVSFKTFYKHYANKEEAFADLFDHAVAGTEAQIAEALAAGELRWPEKVAVAMRSFFESILADPLIARACLVEGPTAGPLITARYERVVRAFVPILKQGREWSEEAKALPETLEDTLAGAVLWAAYQRLSVSEVARLHDLVPENVELVLRPYVGNAEAVRVARETPAVSA